MRSLTHKLTLAFVFVSLAAIGLAAALVWSATSTAFNSYLLERQQADFAAAAQAHYAAHKTWEGLLPQLQQQGLWPPPAPPGQQRPPLPPFVILDAARRVILANGQYQLNAVVPETSLTRGAPIVVEGKTVGTVLSTGQPFQRNPVEEQYLARINQALLWAAIGGAGLAAVLGWWLARTLARPARALTVAARAMARGELAQTVPVQSHDELGELTHAFNQLSRDLTRATAARRQMTADIAHDLRNPLTVINGVLEGLRDGVLQPTPARFDMLHAEAQHLTHLVEDLRTLSLADAGELQLHPQRTAPVALLEALALAYQHLAAQQHITLQMDVESNLPEVMLDPERIEQVLRNLVSNALRYTPSGGRITLAAHRLREGLHFSVTDTGAGLAPDVLPHIFERFYRGEAARSGAQSGLGLTIAKSIVTLHGGQLTATSAGVGQGSCFMVWLPLNTDRRGF